MNTTATNRRGFLKRLAAVCGGLAAIPVLATSVNARSIRRGWGLGGWGGRSFRRGWGFGAPGLYGRGFYGAPFYGGGYYGPGMYGRGYFGGGIAPVPFGGYYGGGYYPAPPIGGYYGGYYTPILKLEKKQAVDALALLEC